MGKILKDATVSIIVIAMITMMILPSSPASTAIKTFGDSMGGAIKDVVGRSS